MSVVYLGGFGRSGSTLVERMLGAAPGWVNVGELVDLARSVAPRDELCGCGTPFSRCPLWTRVGELAFGGWTEQVVAGLAELQRAAARQRHLPGLLNPRHAPSAQLIALRSSYERIYAAVAEAAGASVVVDASKGPALGQALAGAAGIDLRILNVVRDPRAVAWSWSRRVVRPHATAGREEMWRISARRAAAQWTALQLEVEAMARRSGVPSGRLRYEDFVADPIDSLMDAMGPLGLPLGPGDLPRIVDGAVELGPSHGLSGNPARFLSGAVELRGDDGWTTRMPAVDRAVVTTLTLPLLRAYGYPIAPAPSDARRSSNRHETRTNA